MVFIAILASIQMKKEKKFEASQINSNHYPAPLVSVIVPPYNEETNAAEQLKA